jgi:pimeloyl-ACP methyl ester carboxylesterase
MRALLFLLLLAGCAPGLGGDPTLLRVPVVQADGSQVEIVTRLCVPDGGATRPLVLVNHGSPANPAQRANMAPTACSHEAVRFFTARGHAVGVPLRRGYGASGGAWAEGFGRCETPDFFAAGLESARDMRAAIAALAARPEVPRGPVLVVGQSAGGWGALALASQNPPELLGVLNMAGGRGGWRGGMPGSNCAPERLVEAAARYGATSRVRTLWIYTANDSFFAPDLALAMHHAFVDTGGVAQLVGLGPHGADGHGLFFMPGGSEVWGPLAAQKFPQ